MSDKKTMAVADVKGKALDWLVAECQGYTLTSDGINHLLERGNELRILGPNSASLHYSPTTNPSHAHEIIEANGISSITKKFLQDPSRLWLAYIEGRSVESGQFGPTRLIAVMRCYVYSKRGENVEVPYALL